MFIYISCFYNWIAQSFQLSNFFSRSLFKKNGLVQTAAPISTVEKSIFDPLSFLNWWTPDPSKRADSNLDRIRAEAEAKISKQPKVIGYMDFDPMVAAKKLHCDGRRQNHRVGRGGGSFLYN
jgi:hypothetical protein